MAPKNMAWLLGRLLGRGQVSRHGKGRHSKAGGRQGGRQKAKVKKKREKATVGRVWQAKKAGVGREGAA